MGLRTDGRMDGPVNGKDGWINGPVERAVDGPDRRKEGFTNRRKERDGCMDGWMDG